MNILIYQNISNIGGANTYIKNIYKNLYNTNHKVYLLEEKGIFELVKYIFNKRITLVILNLHVPRDLILAISLKIFRIHYFSVVHGLWFLESKSMNPFQSKVVTFKYWITQYVIALLSTKTIVVSKYEYEYIERYFPYVSHKSKIIPGGVDRRIFNPKNDKLFTKYHSFENSSLLIVSRLERRKGIHLAIKALKIVIKIFPNIKLYIIFPAKSLNQIDYFQELIELIDDNNIGKHVIFQSGIKQKDLVKYYRNAKLFISSSVDLETFGLSFIESLNCGCPAICFDTGNPARVLKKIDNRLIAREITDLGLANIILWYLSLDKKSQETIIEKSITVARKYNWKKSAKLLLEEVSVI